jgi:RHH-type transcriptional regulator, rel operon repressor / antitoxin RelB
MPTTFTDKPPNVRLPVAMAGQLNALTKATGRKKILTVEALLEYIEAQAWQVQDANTAL